MNDRLTGESGARGILDAAELPPGPARPVALAVPNVSEGRDAATIEALAAAVRVPGARLLDLHSDPDHERSVLTVAGDPLAVQDAMVALAAEAMERIDLRRHRGVHPRIGALDVVPVVALTEDDLPMACELAEGIARRIGEELALPVFRYGAIAPNLDRTHPHDFRRGGLEALVEAVEEGRIEPDDGPRRIHVTAGAVMVGARPPLIAWNVFLPGASVEDARVIAARIRESGGGLPRLRALGLYLAQAGVAQVSMNLEDFWSTSPAAAVMAVRREAERLGIETGESELVGLIPAAALGGMSPSALRLARFRPGQVLEAHLPSLRRNRPRR